MTCRVFVYWRKVPVEVVKVESGNSESQLVNQAKEGCNRSFEALLVLFGPFIGYKAKTYYIEGGDRKDVRQECMIGLSNAVSDYDFNKKTSFRSFAKLCINRRLLSAVRSASRNKHQVLSHSKNLSELENEYLQCSESDPYEVLKSKERLRILIDHVQKTLSKIERETWKLHKQGFSYDDISAKTGLSRKSVDNALQRAQQKIQKALKRFN